MVEDIHDVLVELLFGGFGEVHVECIPLDLWVLIILVLVVIVADDTGRHHHTSPLHLPRGVYNL